MSNIDWDFILEQEGFETTGHVPDAKKSNSGVTIASGFDLGARKLSDLKGLPKDIIKLLEPFLGLRGIKAEKRAGDLKVSKNQAKIINAFAKRTELAKLKTRWKKATGTSLDKLPKEQATVLASVAFQYGNLESKTPDFWRQTTSGDWAAAHKNLKNFRDNYHPRRKREAKYLAPSLASPPRKPTRPGIAERARKRVEAQKDIDEDVVGRGSPTPIISPPTSVRKPIRPGIAERARKRVDEDVVGRDKPTPIISPPMPKRKLEHPKILVDSSTKDKGKPTMTDRYIPRYQRWQRLLKQDPAKAARNKEMMIRNAKRDLKKLRDEGKPPSPSLLKIVSESETKDGKVTPAHTAAHSAGIAPGILENLLTAGSVVIPSLAGVKIVKGAGNIFRVFKDGKRIGGNFGTGRSAINYVKDKFKNIITPRRGPSVARQPGTEAENLAAVARARAGQRGSRFDRAATGRPATHPHSGISRDFTAAEKLAALTAAKKGLRSWAAINKRKPGGWREAWKKLSTRKKAALLAGTGFGTGLGVNEVAKLLGSDPKVGVARSQLPPVKDYVAKRKPKAAIDWDERLKRFPLVPYGDKPADEKAVQVDKVEDEYEYDFGGDKGPRFWERAERKPGLMPWDWIKKSGPRDMAPGKRVYITPFGEMTVGEDPAETARKEREYEEMTQRKRGGQVRKGLKKTKTRRVKVKPLTIRQREALKSHAKKHTTKHMAYMRDRMKRGDTFKDAHRKATRRVGR